MAGSALAGRNPGGLAQGRRRLQSGGLSPEAMSTLSRRESYGDTYHPGGLIVSDVAGRTDRLPLAVGADSHVIPADVVSGLGQGNSLNGAKVLQAILHIGPYGTEYPRSYRGSGPPRPPPINGRMIQWESHGGATESSPILAAGGEYIISPEQVRRIGGGSLKRGHARLDQLIENVRKHTMHFLRHAPKPKK